MLNLQNMNMILQRLSNHRTSISELTNYQTTKESIAEEKNELEISLFLNDL